MMRYSLWFTFFVLLVALWGMAAHAGDGWQGRPSVCANIPSGPRADRCHYWVQTVQRPDLPGASCCGEADAYIADDFEVVNGELFMIITSDYPPPAGYSDEEGNPVTPPPNTFHASKGMRIKIPPEKMVTRPEHTNRSPHGVIFMSSSGAVFCAILGPLI